MPPDQKASQTRSTWFLISPVIMQEISPSVFLYPSQTSSTQANSIRMPLQFRSAGPLPLVARYADLLAVEGILDPSVVPGRAQLLAHSESAIPTHGHLAPVIQRVHIGAEQQAVVH